MLFYYIQNVYQKNHLGTRSDTRHARVASIHGDGSSGGHSELLSRRFRGRSSLRKFLVSKEHLDWLKIDLNAA